MRIMVGDAWADGFVDPHRSSHSYRVQVLVWVPVEPLRDLFFVRRSSVRMLTNYVATIGLRDVGRKIRSRRAERSRNDKWLAYGAGIVLEGPVEGRFAPGVTVAFVAPRHPRCVERLVSVEALLTPFDLEPSCKNPGRLLFRRGGDPAHGAPFSALRGWDPESGADPRALGADTALKEVSRRLAALERVELDALPCEPSPVSERSRTGDDLPDGITLFGYGNYAKTMVVPTLGQRLPIRTVHELDPTQIPSSTDAVAWDTSPLPRQGERSRVFAAAGYHHTHAPVAVHALRNGADAVVEKPLATDRGQLQDLLRAMSTSSGRLFACFQRRYLPCNRLVRADLGIGADEPLSYHCIVYEVPLPALHWYRWPRSRSRLVSNGCHWLDHFLFLNHFSLPSERHAWEAHDGTIQCAVTLQNGAVFTMVLTDRGSPRVGLRDHVELRSDNATATLVDSSRYRVERGDRLVRRMRFHKFAGHRRMYRSIADAIASGRPGDSVRSVKVSTELVLDLEEMVQPGHATMAAP